jgi:phage gpG-like protein
VDITVQQLAQLLNRFTEAPAEAMRRAGPEMQMLAVANMRRDMTAGISPDGAVYQPLRFSRPQGGNKPLMNTGILRASLSAEVTAEGITLRGSAPGARLHQEGGVVVPRLAKALAIPITPAAVRAGSPRNFPGELFLLKKKDGGKGSLAAREGKGKKARIVVHYLLRNKVTVPARPYLGISKATAEDFADAINRKLGEFIQDQFNGG